MQVTVTGRHFEVTPAVRSYIDVRLGRMQRFMDKLQTAHVTLSVEKRRHRAEILLHSEGKEFTGKETAEDIYSALDRVSEKIEKQLRRSKSRRMTARKSASVRNGAGNGAIEPAGTLRVLRAGSVGHGPQEHDIVEAGDYPLEKLTVDEAIVRLEARNDGFVVFANRGSDLIHIVYKLPDGNYGVLNLHATS